MKNKNGINDKFQFSERPDAPKPIRHGNTRKTLSNHEYRCIVGYTMYWQDIIENAFDMAIQYSDFEKEEIIAQLYACGYDFNDNGKLYWVG